MQGFRGQKIRPGETISARWLNQLVDAVDGLLRLNVGRGLALQWVSGAPQIRTTGEVPQTRHAKTQSGGIGAATSVTQMTSGTVDLWTANSTGALTAVSGVTVTAWNKAVTSIAGNKHILITTDEGGKDIVTWVEC